MGSREEAPWRAEEKRGEERKSGPAPKRQKFMCSNVWVLGVHSIKMHTFSHKELFPPHSVNTAPLALPQSSVQLPSTLAIAAHPMTKPLKPLCQFTNRGLLNRRADMLLSKGIPQGEWRLHPESVQMIWTRFGRAEVDLFTTSENAHCPLFFSRSHSPLEGDALTSHWPAASQAFPQIKILPLVLYKIRE